MLSRVFEPEVMDSPAEAAAYDRMDHAEVNRRFVADLRRFAGDDALQAQILDVGTGTARIPALLCQQLANCQVWAIDLSGSMIHLGRQRLDQLGLAPRIGLALADGKRLPYAAQQFAATLSNSCLHHVADPVTVLAEAVRVTAAGGVLFFRDLLRPPDDAAVRRLVRTYAGGEREREQ
ncbi:MAG: methyltransferase domain-containing protein, partial [Planctomycetales bacterium]|nr:methyltransferase domain-containing protein [Planctomycetales bacterium]NIP04822.1 methyltransferase domain-containing protein [Planctomycetales bacterium]NIP69883.1 methyltransferase domain-containing protein [Planctomycetales bacterium]